MHVSKNLTQSFVHFPAPKSAAGKLWARATGMKKDAAMKTSLRLREKAESEGKKPSGFYFPAMAEKPWT